MYLNKDINLEVFFKLYLLNFKQTPWIFSVCNIRKFGDYGGECTIYIYIHIYT